MGKDTLTGGDGADTFVFATGDSANGTDLTRVDSITDLAAGDKINLATISQNFNLITDKNITDIAGAGKESATDFTAGFDAFLFTSGGQSYLVYETAASGDGGATALGTVEVVKIAGVTDPTSWTSASGIITIG